MSFARGEKSRTEHSESEQLVSGQSQAIKFRRLFAPLFSWPESASHPIQEFMK